MSALGDFLRDAAREADANPQFKAYAIVVTREAALRTFLVYDQAPVGTFECPICGIAEPHAHTAEQVEAYHEQRRRP
jgi:hypothetical protein